MVTTGVALAVAPGCGDEGDTGIAPTALLDVSGTWIGECADANGGEYRVRLSNLSQQGATVSGEWSATHKGTLRVSRGSMTGSVTTSNERRGRGEAASFSGTMTGSGCVTSINFTAKVSESAIWGTHSGATCTGPIRDGRVFLRRE
jgi:hypothetical protein